VITVQTPSFEPTLTAAHARLDAVDPVAYAKTRNHLNGAVTKLSPYITHGMVSLPEVLRAVMAKHRLQVQDKLVFELGWREYFQHVWSHREDDILQSLHAGVMPDEAYARSMPSDIEHARTGVPVVDEAVRYLHAHGWLHNHARMWLASYVVHVRKVHWRVGADWMFGRLIDGDLASNHLSWQWVAGTGSNKPYLFNAENVARFAPKAWHSEGSVVDRSYEAMDLMASHEAFTEPAVAAPAMDALGDGFTAALTCHAEPPAWLNARAPQADDVAGKAVWLVHPWNLGAVPNDLPDGHVVVAVLEQSFHAAWPWSAARWAFVGQRMQAMTACVWHAQAADVGAALAHASSVQSIASAHAVWLPAVARCRPTPRLFGPVAQPCESFSRWWTRVTKHARSCDDLLAASADRWSRANTVAA
jgi:deoxyribodipyrimidine photo-lyase